MRARGGARLRRVGLLVAGIVALVLAGGAVVLLRQSLSDDQILLKDIGQEYLLARALVDGVDPYVPIRDLAARYLEPRGYLDKTIPTPHPPTAGLLFLPALWLDYPTLVRVWSAFELVCLGLAVAWSAQAAGIRLRTRMVPVAAFGLLGWVPVGLDLGLGQVTLALLAGLAGAQFALVHGRGGLAGVLLGLTLLLKPLAWPWLIALVWRRAWAALAGCAAVVAVGAAACALRLGPGVLVDYTIRVLPQVSAGYATEPTNISLWTVGPRLFTDQQTARVVGALVPLGVLVGTLAWLRSRPAMSHALGVLACVSVLVNPISWGYYLVLGILPAAQVLAWLRARGYPKLPLLLASGVGVALCLGGADWRALASLVSFAPLARLIVLGPALSIGALAVLLGWMATQAGGRRWASSSAT